MLRQGLFGSGNGLAHLSFTFGAMNPHNTVFVAPPITEIPDYILYRQYEDAYHLPGRPSRQPKDTSRWFSHPSAEAALQAAKRACRGHAGRWFGRAPGDTKNAAFWVYEDGKVIQRHVVDTIG